MNDEKTLELQKSIHNLTPSLTKREKALIQQGMPIQKIMRFIQFDKVKIFVNYKVLIPRYETEEVLLEALKYIKPKSNVLDLCAGSGFLGLSIKAKVPLAHVTCSDISKSAIKQIHQNAKYNQLDIKVIHSNLFDQINDQFDVIVCNPPYLKNDTVVAESVRRYEPSLALYGGLDGNDYYRQILAKVKPFLKPNGLLIVELGLDNVEYLKAQGFSLKKDMNGKWRIGLKRFN